MPESLDKTEQEIKFRVADEEGLERKGQLVPEQNQPLTPQDLMKVISNPNSHEDEWVAACNVLSQQSPSRKFNGPSPSIRGKIVAGVIGLAIVGSIFGVMEIFHFGPFASPNIDYKSYMEIMQKEIKNRWRPPKLNSSNHVVMHFKLHKNGSVTDVGFDRLSNLSDVDAAALKSVIEAEPSLPPLPDGAPESVDIKYTFDYNVSDGPKLF